MPANYLDENGLEHVVAKAKETFANKKELWNWQKTEKAGAVAFEPVPDSVLEPVVEFKFKETLPAEGEKGPDNPSTIEGVNSIKIGAGNKNLFFNAHNSDMYGLSAVYNEDGSIVLNGTSTQTCIITANLFSGNPFRNETLTFSAGNTKISENVIMRWGGDIGWLRLSTIDAKKTYTIFPGNNLASSNYFQIRIESNTTLDNFIIWPQVEFNSYATSFEKSKQTLYDILFEDNYYGGSLDINSGLLTVTWQAVDISTAEIHYSLDNQVFYFDTPIAEYNEGSYPVCESFVYNQVLLSSLEDGQFRYQNDNDVPAGNIRWLFRATSYTTVESFKDAFAGKKLVYKLAEPITVQLDPIQIKSLASLDKYEPRINTIYTDAESVQVGYQKFTAEGNFVHTTGDENVEGFKIFSNSHITDPGSSPHVLVSSIGIKNDNLLKGIVPEYSRMLSLQLMDSTGTDINHSGRLASFEYQSPNETNTSYRTYMRCWKYLSGDDPHITDGAEISVGYDNDGNVYASAPAISNNRTNSTDIVTRGWRISESEIDELSIS